MEESLSELSNGGIYCGEVDRISNNGNGIVEMQKGTLNLGDIPRSKVGEVVVFKKTTQVYAELVDDDRRSEAERVKQPGRGYSEGSDVDQNVGDQPNTGKIEANPSYSANGLLNNYNNDA